MIKEIFDKLMDYINTNKGKVFGGIIGFAFAILVLSIGFFKTLFIALCTWLGYFLGSKSDSKEDMRELLERILSSGKKN
mgnify:CR=1 FL=1